jgi:hypothetical protein
MTAVMPIREFARAKINLTLKVCGRRPDGYHELQSLVTFADVADEIAFEPGTDASVTTRGPFASEITGANLIETTLHRLREIDRACASGAVSLTKNLPVRGRSRRRLGRRSGRAARRTHGQPRSRRPYRLARDCRPAGGRRRRLPGGPARTDVGDRRPDRVARRAAAGAAGRARQSARAVYPRRVSSPL